MHAASLREDLGSGPCQVVAIPDRWLRTSGYHNFQNLFSLLQWNTRHIASVQMQDIENVIDEILRAARLKHVLERLETRDAVGFDGHHLAVEQRLLDWESAGCLSQLRKFLRPIMAISADEVRLGVVDSTQHPVAVEFDLVQPVISVGRYVLVSVASSTACEVGNLAGLAAG